MAIMYWFPYTIHTYLYCIHIVLIVLIVLIVVYIH